MRTGGLIVAAGMSSRMEEFKPMMQIGSISTIQRVISTMQQVRVNPIVVITGCQAEILEKHIGKMNVICLRNPFYETTEMLDSAKIGFEYLKGKCDRILFSPADTPLFTVNSVKQLLMSDAKLAKPVCNGHGGHPLLVDESMIPSILEYDGEGGLKATLQATGIPMRYIEVQDEGVLFDADTQEDFKELVKHHNEQMLRPKLKLTLTKEEEFFDQRAALLLKLIGECKSMRLSCEQINMSYRKGWDLLNRIEKQLGFAVAVRHPGGVEGGYTELTEDGKEFLKHYERFVEQSEKAIEQIFDHIFGNI